MIQIHWPASPITILILETVLSSVGVAMVLTLHQANAKVCISGSGNYQQYSNNRDHSGIQEKTPFSNTVSLG